MKKLFFFLLIILSLSCNDKEKEINDNVKSKKSLHIQNNGEKIFNGSCASCHLYGTGGSIVLGDKEKWEKIISSQKIDAIYQNVINGYVTKSGIMPSRGGCMNCSDNDLIDAVNYIFLFNSIPIDN